MFTQTKLSAISWRPKAPPKFSLTNNRWEFHIFFKNLLWTAYIFFSLGKFQILNLEQVWFALQSALQSKARKHYSLLPPPFLSQSFPFRVTISKPHCTFIQLRFGPTFIPTLLSTLAKTHEEIQVSLYMSRHTSWKPFWSERKHGPR